MTHGTAGLTAPFPYYGGKRWWAPLVWERFGNPGVYVEGFAGSIACLLARPGGPGPREIVCDTAGGLCNAWRAISLGDPEEVAYWSSWPTIHQDLTARHRWLRRWIAEHAEELSNDPTFFDARAAGWWLWGISLWIGGGWCAVDHDIRPKVSPAGTGPGISAQREQIPYVGTWNGRRGVSQHAPAQDKTPATGIRNGRRGVSQHTAPPDRRPRTHDRPGGFGIAPQRLNRPELLAWFTALQERLAAVIVLNRSWESAVTPTMLQRTSTGPKPAAAVLLDPPYVDDDRAEIYNSDYNRTSTETSARAFDWAVENGSWCRIAYFCHEGDYDVPDGWTAETRPFSGIRRHDRQRREMAMFSPACLDPAQGSLDLFADTERPLAREAQPDA